MLKRIAIISALGASLIALSACDDNDNQSYRHTTYQPPVVQQVAPQPVIIQQQAPGYSGTDIAAAALVGSLVGQQLNNSNNHKYQQPRTVVVNRYITTPATSSNTALSKPVIAPATIVPAVVPKPIVTASKPVVAPVPTRISPYQSARSNSTYNLNLSKPTVSVSRPSVSSASYTPTRSVSTYKSSRSSSSSSSRSSRR